MVMLTLAEAGRNGAMGTGVDEYFFIRGHKDNKPIAVFRGAHGPDPFSVHNRHWQEKTK